VRGGEHVCCLEVLLGFERADPPTLVKLLFFEWPWARSCDDLPPVAGLAGFSVVRSVMTIGGLGI
jgi:hypothetical protein